MKIVPAFFIIFDSVVGVRAGPEVRSTRFPTRFLSNPHK